MKIIEALKKIKDLKRKADDIKNKIAQNSADLDTETPNYGTVEKQKAQIEEWIQAHSDILKEILKLKIAIQKTNLATTIAVVAVEGKNPITKSMAEWVIRRRDLAPEEASVWQHLTNKRLQPITYKKPTDTEASIANVRKYYNQAHRDRQLEIYTSEPSKIDAALEIANATTDLIE